jgi:gamma-carbonic anhydrase
VTHETHPLVVGAAVVVGHAAVLHGCTIEDGALIGIGARVLDGAVVERGAQVGAGAVVTPGHRIPAGHLALGVPARAVRALTPGEAHAIAEIAERYVALKERYRGVG